MSWLFSQALVAEYSAGTSLDGAPSSQLSVMPTPHKFWRSDKTIESSDHSRFGLTSQVLTDDHGAELLMSYLAASRARTSARPARAPESTASAAGYGGTCGGLFATYSHASCGWKTVQFSLLEDSTEFLETWPRWGSMRNGESFLRKIPALPTRENVSGFLRGEIHATNGKLWPTPTVHGNHNQPGASPNAGWGLSSAVKQWPTPTASLGSKGGLVTERKGREGGTLIEAVSARMWATPLARDWRSGKASSATHGKNSRPLSEQVVMDRLFPTPTAGSTHSAGTMQEWGGSNNWVRKEDPDLASGQLNPEWVEWLMGWPIGWTELKPLEMDRFLEWQRQHGRF
jgi:hypothetical protein